MDKGLHTSLHSAMHHLLQGKQGEETIKTVGATVLGIAGPLLATPAAPIVIGAVAIGGAVVGVKKLFDWLGS